MSANLEFDEAEYALEIQRLSWSMSENSPQPMIAVEGTTHVIRYLNPAFARLVGNQRKDLIGRPFAEVLPEEDENGCAALLDRVFRTGNPGDLAEQEHRQTQSQTAYWSYAVWAILGKDKRPTGLVIQVTDSTEAALFRQQAVAMNETLVISATQQHEHAEEARSLSQRLQTAIHARDHFIAVLGHELRNPLAAIRNAVTLAVRSGTREDLEWSLDVTARQVSNFARLIDDLLEVSRVSQGKIQLRKELVDAESIIRNAAETVRPLVEERRHELLLSSTDQRVEADPTRLEQMLVNLLTNAAKYTPSGGRIELIVAAESKKVVFRVRDNGVGIAPELLPTIFDLFVQADCYLDRSEGGLGIGLTLVRSLAELHGGSVTVTSEGPGRGSEFVVQLPAAEGRVVAGPDLKEKSAVSTTRQLRILVVDDNADTAKGLARLLKFSGHEVRVAHDGPDALASAREHVPEVVILDIGLPGMDGYQVATIMRQEEGGKEAMIIAVSGYGEEQARSRSSEAGFNHHLVKPVDFDTLLALITRHAISL